MNDNEIIKALEWCTGEKGCFDGCPFRAECCEDLDALEKACLDLIKRQKAEIESLKDALREQQAETQNIIRSYATDNWN